jgi:signal transduction histidine kinase
LKSLPDLLDGLRRIAELAEATARDARQTVWEMRPLVLAHADLPTALREATRRVAAGHEVRVTVEGEYRTLPHNIEDTVLRIAQESATNAVKHSGPGAVTVTFRYRPDGVGLTVADSGKGFDVETAFRSYAGRWGLIGMRERASRIGASLSVRSHQGGGTTVQLDVPISDGRELGVASG